VRAFAAIEGLDRRWLYAMLFVAVLVPSLLALRTDVTVTAPVRSFFDEIERLERAPGRLVVVAIDWDPHTKAENQPQTEAAIRHLLRKRVPFAVVTLVSTGAGFCEEIPSRLAAEFGAEYGRDWVDWGYRYGWGIFIKKLASDIPGALKTDAHGTPLEKIPLMAGVKDATSVDLVCEFTGLVGALESWLQFFQTGGARPRFVHGCTAVSAPSNRVFLDSAQISGLLGGMLAAAEYEQLLGSSARGSRGMQAQTAAHAAIIFLIVLGNAAEVVRRRSERRTGGGAS